jgi:competence protein ComEC
MSNPAPAQIKQRSPFQGFLPFFWLAFACIGGIILADRVSIPAWAWLAGMVACILALILAWRLPKRLVLTHHLRRLTRIDQRLPGALMAAVFFLGGWRYASARLVITPEHAAYYNDRGTVQLVGTVIRPPDYRDNVTNLTVQVESLLLLSEGQQTINPDAIDGRVLIQVHPGSAWAYGMQIRLIGQLRTPPEGADFSFQIFLARKGILSLMTQPQVDRVEFNQGNPVKTLIFDLHARADATLQALFPSPESDLLAGILLGRDQGLSPALQDAFRRTGTTHIIAISGFNIAILAGLFTGVFTRLLGRNWGALAAIGAISGYAVFVGGDAAVTRAAIMGTLGVMGGMFGRRQNGLNSLGLAALGMAVVNPNIPWDIGFQLSIAATLGLVLYAQPLEERFVRLAAQKMPEERAQKLVGPVSEFFLFTLAAQMMTLPIMIYHFGGVSWITMVANPLILPTQALVMVLGGLAVLMGLILPGLGQVLAVICLPFVRYTIRMVTWLARLPGSELLIPEFHVLWLAVFYGLLFSMTLFTGEARKTAFKNIFSPQAGVLVLTGLVVLVWSRVLSAPDGRLHLTLIDDQGTVLVQAPSGHALLIGGGVSASSLNQSLGEMLPAGDQRLDMLIIGSTAREDLLGLISVIKKVPIDAVLWGVDPEANQTSRTVYALLADQGVPVHALSSVSSLDFDDGLTINLLYAGERGAVLWLTWEDFSALILTGKVGDHWLSPPMPPDVLFLPDDSAVDDLPLEQITLWAPVVILLPVEQADLFILQDQLGGYPVLTSQAHGWVRVSTDGRQVWVRTEK